MMTDQTQTCSDCREESDSLGTQKVHIHSLYGIHREQSKTFLWEEREL